MESRIKKKSRVSRRKSIKAVLELGQCWTVAVHKNTLTVLVMRVRLIEICLSPVLMVKFQYQWGKHRKMQNEQELSSMTGNTFVIPNIKGKKPYFFQTVVSFFAAHTELSLAWNRNGIQSSSNFKHWVWGDFLRVSHLGINIYNIKVFFLHSENKSYDLGANKLIFLCATE